MVERSQNVATVAEKEQRAPMFTKQQDVSSFFALPFDLTVGHSLTLANNLITTPPWYEHGPRKGCRYGPLIGYPEHAAILTEALEDLVEATAGVGGKIAIAKVGGKGKEKATG